MPFEVEQKYRVASHAPTVAALGAWDVALGDPIKQVDCYFRHPQRDFAQTDEALRIRTVGEKNFLTYKGPKLDSETKTRHEEEVRFDDGPEAKRSFERILSALGFESVTTVTKHRIVGKFERDGFHIEVALDQVDALGSFVEIEIPVSRDAERSAAERVADQQVEAAKHLLATLANELGLSQVERRSYLELLPKSKTP